MARYAGRELSEAVNRSMSNGSIDVEFLRKSPEKVFTRDAEMRYLRSKSLRERFKEDKIRHERTPGNYSIRFIDEKPVFCYYDFKGREYRYPLGESKP